MLQWIARLTSNHRDIDSSPDEGITRFYLLEKETHCAPILIEKGLK